MAEEKLHDLRNDVLNSRFEFEEGTLNNDQANAVLRAIDRYLAAPPASGEARTPMTPGISCCPKCKSRDTEGSGYVHKCKACGCIWQTLYPKEFYSGVEARTATDAEIDSIVCALMQIDPDVRDTELNYHETKKLLQSGVARLAALALSNFRPAAAEEATASEQPATQAETIIPKIGGKTQRCERCGSNCFHWIAADEIECNACGTRYHAIRAATVPKASTPAPATAGTEGEICRALQMCVEAIDKHDEWCGNLATAPGNGIFHRATDAAKAALATLAKSPAPTPAATEPKCLNCGKPLSQHDKSDSFFGVPRTGKCPGQERSSFPMPEDEATEPPADCIGTPEELQRLYKIVWRECETNKSIDAIKLITKSLRHAMGWPQP